MPPYIVFSDQALLDMSARRPTTLEAFARVKGVGGVKLQKYGKIFIAVIEQFDAALPI